MEVSSTLLEGETLKWKYAQIVWIAQMRGGTFLAQMVQMLEGGGVVGVGGVGGTGDAGNNCGVSVVAAAAGEKGERQKKSKKSREEPTTH